MSELVFPTAYGREADAGSTGDPDFEVPISTDHSTDYGAERYVPAPPSEAHGREEDAGPPGSNSRTEPVTREDLMERGVPVNQASARVVRAHEEQVIAQHYRVFILSFFCLVIFMLPVILGVFIWMVVEWNRYRETDCDVPLQTWCYVVCLIMIFNLTMRQFVIKYVCRWQPAPQDGADLVLNQPVRVKLFNTFISIFMFVWTCVGLHFVRISGTLSSARPPCRDEAPGLWAAVRTYAAINLCFTVFLYVYLHGILRILGSMMRAGMLQTNQAAPPGSLEASTERVDMGNPLLQESPQCSVCLDDFTDKKDIVRTKECNHVFHKQCLHGWLKVQRSCPLCRRDLGMSPDPHPVGQRQRLGERV